MGHLMSTALDRLSGLFSGGKEARILMLGLDAAGKTTTVYNMKLGEVVHTTPTIGFNVERVAYKSVDFTIWDIGGQEKIRRLWRYYYEGTDALIYIVDSADRDRLDEAREELEAIISTEEMKDAHVLVFANKQDLPGAASPAEIADKFSMEKMATGKRKWWVQGCCATTGEGLVEGLDWLTEALAGRAK